MPEFSYTYTRDNLASLLDDVESTREPVIIKRRGHRDAVVIDGDELRSLEETAHLLRSPENARRLLEALLEVREDVERVLSAAKLSTAPASVTPLDLPEETLRAFCEKWNIEKLEIFGSTARGEARADSDVDLVATFEDGDRHGLFDLAEMRAEIEELLGRSVDLLERGSIDNMKNPIRKKSIMKDLRAIYRA